jgi:hypothetical protein
MRSAAHRTPGRRPLMSVHAAMTRNVCSLTPWTHNERGARAACCIDCVSLESGEDGASWGAIEAGARPAWPNIVIGQRKQGADRAKPQAPDRGQRHDLADRYLRGSAWQAGISARGGSHPAGALVAAIWLRSRRISRWTAVIVARPAAARIPAALRGTMTVVWGRAHAGRPRYRRGGNSLR